MNNLTWNTVALTIDALGILTSLVFSIIGDKLNIALLFAFIAMLIKDLVIRDYIEKDLQ